MTVFETKIYSCIVIYLHKTVQLHIMRKNASGVKQYVK